MKNKTQINMKAKPRTTGLDRKRFLNFLHHRLTFVRDGGTVVSPSSSVTRTTAGKTVRNSCVFN